MVFLSCLVLLFFESLSWSIEEFLLLTSYFVLSFLLTAEEHLGGLEYLSVELPLALKIRSLLTYLGAGGAGGGILASSLGEKHLFTTSFF